MAKFVNSGVDSAVSDVDELMSCWGNTPILSMDADDADVRQNIMRKRDIMTIYEDYMNISKNSGASRNCIKLGVVERVAADPMGFFDALAEFALASANDLNIRDVMKACNVVDGSLIDVSTVFQNWYCIIMGTDTPVAGSAKTNIFKDPAAPHACPSYMRSRPPALIRRHNTSDTEMSSSQSAPDSVRRMDTDLSSVRSTDYQQSNFVVRRPSWDHGNFSLPTPRGQLMDDPEDPTAVVLPPVDNTGLVSPDQEFFRNILGDTMPKDAPLPPARAPPRPSMNGDAPPFKLPSKDMDDDEFYANLEEVTNIISCTSFDDYGGRYDTTSPRRKMRLPDSSSAVADAVPIVSDSDETPVPAEPPTSESAPVVKTDTEEHTCFSEDVPAQLSSSATRVTSTSSVVSANGAPGGAPGAGAVPNVQRRKRRKLMDIVEVLSDGTKLSRTILAPKGIYKTPHGFRVQLNIDPIIDESGHQSASAKRGKFSRNAKNFEDAMWVYEVAILISDCPSDVQTMLVRGNFESMLSMTWFSSTTAYMFNLTSNIKKLHSIKILNNMEYDLAVAALEQVSTADKSIPPQFLDLTSEDGAVELPPPKVQELAQGHSVSSHAVVSGGGEGGLDEALLRLDSFEYHLRDDDFEVLESL
jgi:hypothetical protein